MAALTHSLYDVRHCFGGQVAVLQIEVHGVQAAQFQEAAGEVVGRVIADLRALKVEAETLDAFDLYESGADVLHALKLDVVVADADVDFLEFGLLRDEPADVVTALFGEAAGVEDQSNFGDRLDQEDRVAEVFEGEVCEFVVGEVEVKYF